METPMSPEVREAMARLPLMLADEVAFERYGHGLGDRVAAGERRIALAEGAEDAARDLETAFEVALTATEDDLTLLDALVEHGWDGTMPSEEDLAAMALSWGSWLGELIRAHLGGEWVVREQSEHDSLHFSRIGHQFFPAHAILRRFALGRTAELATGYEELVAQLVGE